MSDVVHGPVKVDVSVLVCAREMLRQVMPKLDQRVPGRIRAKRRELGAFLEVVPEEQCVHPKALEIPRAALGAYAPEIFHGHVDERMVGAAPLFEASTLGQNIFVLAAAQRYEY